MRAGEAQFPESRAVFAPTPGGKLLAGICNMSSPLRPPRSAAPLLQVSSDAAGASERRMFMIAVIPEFDALLKGCAPSKCDWLRAPLKSALKAAPNSAPRPSPWRP
jgi:hypothetical protein